MSLKKILLMYVALLFSDIYCMQRAYITVPDICSTATPVTTCATSFCVNTTNPAYQFAKYLDFNSTFKIQLQTTINLADDRIWLFKAHAIPTTDLLIVKNQLVAHLQEIQSVPFANPIYKHIADSTIKEITDTIQKIDTAIQKASIAPTITQQQTASQTKFAAGRARAYMLSKQEPVAKDTLPQKSVAIPVNKQQEQVEMRAATIDTMRHATAEKQAQQHAEAHELQAYNAQLETQYTHCKKPESKIALAFDLIAQHDKLVSNHAPKVIIDTCDAMIHTCLQEVAANLKPIFGKHPEFLKNCGAARFLGITDKDSLWQQIGLCKHDICACIHKLGQPQTLESYKEIRDSLQKTALSLKLTLSKIEEMNTFGFDFSGINPVEYNRIVDGLRTTIRVINESMIGSDKIGVHSIRTGKFSIEHVIVECDKDKLSLEDTCAYLVGTPTDKDLKANLEAKSKEFVDNVIYTSTYRSPEALQELVEKIETKIKQDPPMKLSEEQYHKRIEVLRWQKDVVQARIAFRREYPGHGPWCPDVEQAVTNVLNTQRERQANPVSLKEPDNICDGFTWHMGGFKAAWQEFAEAHHYINKAPVTYDLSQVREKEKRYAILVNDRMAMREMLYYAKQHPEIRMGKELFYKFVERDLKKANELIKEIEYPSQQLFAPQQERVQPMRLAEEDLFSAIDRQKHEQHLKDKHDLGKQIKAALWTYATKELLCVSFLTTFGDGSGTAQLSGKLGPETIFNCNTKDIIDGLMKLAGRPALKTQGQVDETKKQESIQHAKTVHAATTLSAAQQRIEQQTTQAQAAATGASNTQKIHGPAVVMQPVADTQQAPSATFSAQLQKLDEQVDQYGISRAAAYKKAIQITLEKQGKTAAVERQVPAQVKAFIDRTGQDAQVFEHAKATPIAHEIIQDAYQNIEKLHEGLMMAPGMNLPEAQMDLVFTAVNLSVAAADAAQKGNYDAAIQLSSYAQRGLECVKAFGTQAFEEAARPVLEMYFKYKFPHLEWHEYLEKLSLDEIRQYTDPKVQSSAQAGKKMGEIIRQVAVALITHKAADMAKGAPPAGLAPQFVAAGADDIAIPVVAADGVAVAGRAAAIVRGVKATTALMAAGDGPQQSGGSSTSSKSTRDQKAPQEAPQQESVKQDRTLKKDTLPLDRRKWTPEQIEADTARKAQGGTINDRGRAFENQLQKQLGGRGSFKERGANTGTREFDGAAGNIWYEAKSGDYWEKIMSSKEAFESFVGKMGEKLKIALEHGAKFELYSNTPIPQTIKEWCAKKGITFKEWL